MKPQPYTEAYGFFVRPVNQDTVQQLLNVHAFLSQKNIRHIHLAMNSTGGLVCDGLAL